MKWFSSLFGKQGEDAEQHAPISAGPLVTTTATAPDGALPPPAVADDRKQPLPRFRDAATAPDHADTHPHDRIRRRLRQAFTPTRPIMHPTMLAGRTELLRTMIRAIEDQYLHIVLFGPRGIGKTSLLHALCGTARQSGYLVRYASCGEQMSFDELFRAIMAHVPLLFHAHYDPAGTEIEEGLTFADLLDDRSITVEQASDLLDKITGTRLLVVLDEFDRASRADFRRSIAQLIKNVSDRGIRTQLIIAGVAGDLNEIFDYVPAIQRNILGLLVPNMTQDEIAELLSNGQQASGMTFTPKALQFISLAALGLPYLASLVGQHAAFAALDRGSTAIDHSDVDRGLADVLRHLHSRIAPDVRQCMERAINDGHGLVLGQISQSALAKSYRARSETEIFERSFLYLEDSIDSTDDPTSLDLTRHRADTSNIKDVLFSESYDNSASLYMWLSLLHRGVINLRATP